MSSHSGVINSTGTFLYACNGLTYIYRLKFNDFYVGATLADQLALTGTPFSFTVPTGTFVEGTSDNLTYAATNLPAWLTFDTNTVTFNGTPSVEATNVVTIIATDIDGSTMSTPLRIITRAVTDLYITTTMQTTGGNKVMTFQFTALPNTGYRLQRTSALLNPSTATVWTDIYTTVTTSGQNSVTFYDTNAPAPSFYRIKTP